MSEHSDDAKMIDRQWSERYRQDKERWLNEQSGSWRRETAYRHTLIALRIQMKADGPDKWRTAIASIDRALDDET